MTKSPLRILLAALVLALLLPVFAAAQGGVPDVYIAVDRASMLPLAGALAYQAEQSGLNTTVIDMFAGADRPLYTTGDDVSLSAALEEFRGGKMSDADKSRRFCEFIKAFFQDTEFSAAPTQVYILSGYEREKQVYGRWDDDQGKFNQNQLQRAYAAATDKLSAYPDLNLQFIYSSEEPQDKDKLDEKLAEIAPGRVSVSVLPNNTADPAYIAGQLLPAPSALKTINETMTGGQLALSPTGLSTLLAVSFDAAAPSSVTFVPADSLSAGEAEAAETAVEASSAVSEPTQTAEAADTAEETETIAAEEAALAGSEPEQATEAAETAEETMASSSEEAAPLDLDAMLAAEDVLPLDSEAQQAADDAQAESETEAVSADEDGSQADSETMQAAEAADTDAGSETDAAASAGIPSFYDAEHQLFWLLLPEGTQDGVITAADASGAPLEAPCFIRIWSAVTPAVVTLTAPDGQALTAGQGFTLHDEANAFTIAIDQPGFTQTDLLPTLTMTLEQSDGPVEIAAEITPDESGANLWRAEFPPFGNQGEGHLTFRYSAWSLESPVLDFPFRVENRAPELAEGIVSPVSLTAYFDMPGKTSVPMTFDLSQYFLNADVSDTIAYTVPAQENFSFSYAIDGDTLVYTASGATAAPVQLTVTATDSCGASASCTFAIEHQSVKLLLDQLRTQPLDQSALSVPIGSEVALAFTLPAETLQSANNAFRALGLPAVEECLRVYANDEPVALTAAPDGALTASVTLAARENPAEIALAIRAELALAADAAPVALDRFFSAPQYTVRVVNTPPRLQDGVEASRSAEADISGMPGRYRPVNLSSLFGDLIPGDLFINDESIEQLTFRIQAPAGSIRVFDPLNPGMTLNPDASGVYTLTGASAYTPLRIDLLTAGDTSVEIWAADNQFESERVVLNAGLKSTFIRMAIIVAVIAIIAIAAAAALVIIRLRMRPSFEGAHADISCLRAHTRDVFADERAYTSLPLQSYDKTPITLMTLLAASGQFPPAQCDPEVLTHIVLSPEKGGGFRVNCSGAADDDRVQLFVNGRAADENVLHLDSGQVFSIRFAQTERREMLFIRMYRR